MNNYDVSVTVSILMYWVLSESVATAMKLTGGDEVTETVRFIEMFDKFFDCLNVNNFTTSHHKRKVSATDFRLKV